VHIKEFKSSEVVNEILGDDIMGNVAQVIIVALMMMITSN
jgi:hypothetical protein